MQLAQIPVEYRYIIVLFCVLLLPKILLRYRIPTAITALSLGALCSIFLGWFEGSQVILLLSRLGITSLFLFAGMEIDLDVLKGESKPLLSSVTQFMLLILVSAFITMKVVDLSYQVSLIIAIALFTPSAGFILNSLKNYELNDKEIFWIKLKAISKEIAAVLALFIALKLDNIESFFITIGVIIGMFLILNPLFKFYLNYIAPSAGKSELSFLIIIAFACGILTKKLGTHYLVGGFIVGIVAGQFKHFNEGKDAQRIEDSLQAFFSIFIPFYFFKSGLLITKEFFHLNGLWKGLGLITLLIPLRILSIILSIKFFLPEFWRERKQIAVALTPNLIFGLVIIDILKARFNLETSLLSALLIYTLVASILPAFFLKKSATVEYDSSRIKLKKKNS